MNEEPLYRIWVFVIQEAPPCALHLHMRDWVEHKE